MSCEIKVILARNFSFFFSFFFLLSKSYFEIIMLEIKNQKEMALTEHCTCNADKYKKEYLPILEFDFLLFQSISCEMCMYFKH